jgi:hypothetical protein
MIRTLSIALVLTMTAPAAVKIDKTNYKGWPNSYRISNGEVELVITSDIGPRVMRYGFVGGQNLFKEFADGLGKSGEAVWQLRGGHRIWVAPEDREKTYAPDNGPIKVVVKGSVLEATEPVEPLTGLEKQIIVKLSPTGSAVELVHRIRNTNAKAVEWAAWALTMMAQGGVGIHGFPPRGTHPEMLAATNPLTMWAFSDLTDNRWTFTKKYMMLRQDAKNTGQPQKLGTFNPHTWGAYLLGSDLFIKHYAADAKKQYPDFGCSFETFTNAEFLEIETLGPMTKIEPGKTLEHVERWTLHKNVKVAAWTDAELDRVVAPLVAK